MKFTCFKYLSLCGVLALTSFTLVQPPVKVYLAGDSTMSWYDLKRAPLTGWGMPFANYFDHGVIVVNDAKAGRSTRTFIAEGRWKQIADSLHNGDYVLIQFGHNDEGDSVKYKDRYTPVADYKVNLLKFINETKAKNANPLLLTTVHRRYFDTAGNIKETHKAYTEAMIEVGRQNNVPVIDLDQKSRAVFQQLGPENSKLLFMQLDSAEHPNYPVGRLDNTHFNAYGARRMAELVLNGLKALKIPLAEHIVKGTNKPNVAPSAK